MAAARAIRCELRAPKTATYRRSEASSEVPTRISVAESENGKIMLQPRMCTLRSYGSDPIAVVKTRRDGGDGALPFFETLSEYIESSKKSQDFEIISGRLAMIVFAATVTTEVVTGNSLFRKMDLQGIEEAAGACLGAVTFAAIFAWFSSARNRVGRMFTFTCNTFIDSLIDQIVDGLFYESELTDWSDDI
ncbi:stress enhanced protein 2, chloroplastic isoform X1 [Morus notabilis]|uniref:stress enhanced protein 2, chloroplastic isoform X1 n=1 Tax=Morus notabilis TaxID=981085 RepID=UPI000CED40E0|nr:stress enhanced protein 2, chloroplastic isoform X1 [Morus notabilis]